MHDPRHSCEGRSSPRSLASQCLPASEVAKILCFVKQFPLLRSPDFLFHLQPVAVTSHYPWTSAGEEKHSP
jgi:hypothetical protein